MATVGLHQLGWNQSLQLELMDANESRPAGLPVMFPCRVTRRDRNRYQLIGEDGPIDGEVSNRMLSASEDMASLPAVGDWVLATTNDDGTCIVREVLPRFSSFSRKVAGETTRQQIVAANVDTVFLVSGLDNDFNVRRIERYVTLAWNSGATPVIVLNKSDLVDDIDAFIRQVNDVAFGIDVVCVSTLGAPGIESLRSYLQPGKTVALLGSSGVGKSSIVNAIRGDDSLATAPVREDDSRGRHTTTYRELFVTPDGALLIDTPGMRELQLWAEEEDVQQTFPEIEELATQCRFSDCAHVTEPGCAVREAIENGSLDLGRLRSYDKLMKEVAYLELRKGQTSHELRKHDKALGKMYKNVQQHNRKNKG